VFNGLFDRGERKVAEFIRCEPGSDVWRQPEGRIEEHGAINQLG
jgi:hypothetical protein